MSDPELRPSRPTGTREATPHGRAFLATWKIHSFSTLGPEIQSPNYDCETYRAQFILFWPDSRDEAHFQLNLFGVSRLAEIVQIEIGPVSEGRPAFHKSFEADDRHRQFVFRLGLSYATVRELRCSERDVLQVRVVLPIVRGRNVTFPNAQAMAPRRRLSADRINLQGRSTSPIQMFARSRGFPDLPRGAPAPVFAPEPSTSSKDATGCVGLLNQGTTCYLNSLLQSLFHLPAFRRLVFDLPTNGTEDPATSIPLALQRLFARLQTSATACSTRDFTASLGWSAAETFVQHDAQEFGRVLMENMERKLLGTQLENGIADLFRGQIAHCVRCLNVPVVSERHEPFYELSLQVAGCATLAESLAQYIAVEMLADKYATDAYGAQDAQMGVEIISVPAVLHLHLTRFTYDVATWRPVKLNGRFEFPLEIDLAPFIRGAERPVLYDLFGVLVHSGGTAGGHYYAFLRTSPALEFFKFNDSIVTRETLEKAVEDNFGGEGKSYSAYLLVYVRREEIPRIFAPIDDDSIPTHLRDFVAAIEADERRVKEERIQQSKVCTIAIGTEADIVANVARAVSGFKPANERVISIERTASLVDLYERIALEVQRPVAEVRIWETNYQKVPTRVVAAAPDVTLGTAGITGVFVQFKEEHEPLKLEPSAAMVWVKFFCQTQESLKFIGGFGIDRGVPLEALLPSVRAKMELPSTAELCLFQESLTGTALELDLGRSVEGQKLETGSVIVCQYPPGRDPNPPPGVRIVTEKEPVDGMTPIEYRDVFPDEIPQTIGEFLTASSNKGDVELFDFDHPSEQPLALLRVSASLSFERLKKMISRLLSLSYAPENDTLALYRISDPKTDAPIPMSTILSNTLRSLLSIPPVEIKRHRVFFQFIPGTSEEVFANSSKYPVQFSRDGIHVEFETKVLAPKRSTCRQIFGKLGIDCDFSTLRYCKVYNHRIDQVVSEDSEVLDLFFTLRIEVVPENQRHEGDYRFLLPIAYGYRDGSSITKTKKDPFFFPVLDGEPFSDTKQRLIAAIGWESGEGVIYRFVVDKGASESEISDDTVLSEVATYRSALIVISKEDAKPMAHVSGRGPNQAVRIYN